MTWTLWSWYLLTAVVAAISPGPAVFLVVSQALQGGRARGFWASLGILSTNAFYFMLSALGLGAILSASHRLFVVMKWLGAAYLVYLGVRTFTGQSTLSLSADATEPDTDAASADDPGASVIASDRPVRIWFRGVVLQMANPKAMLFFTALLPQFIRASMPIPQQMVILGTTSVVAELFVLLAYGALAGRLSVMARQPRFVTVTNRVSGALLVSAGTAVALASER